MGNRLATIPAHLHTCQHDRRATVSALYAAVHCGAVARSAPAEPASFQITCGASTITNKRVAIIGAGISGLAYAEVLTRCGFAVVLFDHAPCIGGVWARAYPGVSLQNTAAEYHLSTFAWPFTPEQHPTGEQILCYLHALVEARRFDVRLRHEVLAARADSPRGWLLEIRRSTHNGKDEQTFSQHFDYLVVSTGQYSEGKHRPPLAGEPQFAGSVVTERDVKDLSMFDGARVAVVGFGKSALDMASFAAPRAAQVHHIFRTPRWLIPRSVYGIHFTKLMFCRFTTALMPGWAQPTALERVLHRCQPLIKANWAAVGALMRHLAIRDAGHTDAVGAARVATVLPSHGLTGDLRSALALAPADYFAQVASGTIMPHHAEVAGLFAEGVELSSGTRIAADIVVLSLGSLAPRFPFLNAALRALLEAENDGVQLYRHVIHPLIPELAFAGFNHGFMHVPAAEVGALWVAALWQDKMQLPPPAVMAKSVAHVLAWKRQHIHFEASRSCAVSTRFQQYIDIMLADLGLSPYRKLPNVLAEIFSAYGASDYRGVVDEFLAQPVSGTRHPLDLNT